MTASAARIAVVLSGLFVLAGCVTGGLREAALAPEPTTITALDGGLVGQAPQLRLPAPAQRAALDAEYQALQFGRVGLPVTWEAGGFSGEVTPTQLYRVGSQDCRGYSHRVTKGGQTLSQAGAACRDGSLWSPIA